MTLDLNTQQEDILLKEYGRNMQNIIKFIMTVEDRQQRTIYARTCIELMKQINPNYRETQESERKLWDQLYIMSNFKLDVDSEHPMPEPSAIGKRPDKVDYNINNLRFRHYGKSLTLMVKDTIEETDPQKKDDKLIFLIRFMKRLYTGWNKENVDDVVLLQELKILSQGKLDLTMERIKAEGILDFVVRDRPQGIQVDQQPAKKQHHFQKNKSNFQQYKKKKK